MFGATLAYSTVQALRALARRREGSRRECGGAERDKESCGGSPTMQACGISTNTRDLRRHPGR
jgi:hypothetical protein